MASSSFFIIFAIAACFVPSILATDHMVGDDSGWTTNFDYQTWAQGKEFRVGDRLGNVLSLIIVYVIFVKITFGK